METLKTMSRTRGWWRGNSYPNRNIGSSFQGLAMIMYGYAKKELDESGLLELREVSFECQPSTLRSISEFLSKMADKIDDGTFSHDHEHIDSHIHGWIHENPECDIIVLRP